ncbi:hypothetical protein Tco_1307412, partial [Tanacetum coccineum]
GICKKKLLKTEIVKVILAVNNVTRKAKWVSIDIENDILEIAADEDPEDDDRRSDDSDVDEDNESKPFAGRVKRELHGIESKDMVCAVL